MSPAPPAGSQIPPGDYAGLGARQLIARLFGYSFSYGALNLLTKLGGFFLFPVFWRFLTPADYGVIGLVVAAQGLAGAFMTFGLESGLGRHYHEWSEEERPRKIGALWILSAGSGLLVTVLLDVLGARWASLFVEKVSFQPYLRIGLWTAYLGSLATFPFIILRVTERIRFFGAASMAAFATSTGLALWLVAGLRWGPYGYLLATLINAGLWAAFWCAWMIPRVRLAWDPALIRAELRYSLPAIPINLAGQLDGSLDRFFIDKTASLSQIGLYSLGKRFGEFFNMLNQSLKTAWMPMIFKMTAQREDFPALLPRLSLAYLWALGAGALGLALLSEELILLFGGGRFDGIYPYVPWFILAYFIKNFATAWGRGMDIAKRPQLELIPVYSGAAANLVLLALLVPSHGLRGGLVAFIASSLIASGLQVWLAHRCYPRTFPALRIAGLLASLIAAAWIGSLCGGHWALALALKAAVTAAWAAGAGFWLRGSLRLARAGRG